MANRQTKTSASGRLLAVMDAAEPASAASVSMALAACSERCVSSGHAGSDCTTHLRERGQDDHSGLVALWQGRAGEGADHVCCEPLADNGCLAEQPARDQASVLEVDRLLQDAETALQQLQGGGRLRSWLLWLAFSCFWGVPIVCGLSAHLAKRKTGCTSGAMQPAALSHFCLSLKHSKAYEA